jgi:uncharacterized RmlC-like cupin family protein
MERIEVVRGHELKKADSTQGIVRSKAFEATGVLYAQSRIAGGVVSGWHHHGERDLYGFLASGRLRLQYGEGEKDAVELAPGDFFHIPIGLVHRDVNPDQHDEAVVVNMLLGQGPTVVNVEGP